MNNLDKVILKCYMQDFTSIIDKSIALKCRSVYVRCAARVLSIHNPYIFQREGITTLRIDQN